MPFVGYDLRISPYNLKILHFVLFFMVAKMSYSLYQIFAEKLTHIAVIIHLYDIFRTTRNFGKKAKKRSSGGKEAEWMMVKNTGSAGLGEFKHVFIA